MVLNGCRRLPQLILHSNPVNLAALLGSLIKYLAKGYKTIGNFY